jgi:hypothetical protein
MREDRMNKFDKIVWRINGVLILCVGVVAGIALLFALYEIFKDKSRDRNVSNIININEETEKKEYLFLGSFSKIKGRKLFICPLRANQEYERSYYSKSASSVRNYLYFSQYDSSSHWLLESNNWLIINKHSIYTNFSEDENIITISFFYEIVKKDTNGDGILNHDDNKSIYHSQFNGTNLIVVLEETTDIQGINQIDDNKTIIFQRNDRKSQAVVVDNSTGNIIKKSDLPIEG